LCDNRVYEVGSGFPKLALAKQKSVTQGQIKQKAGELSEGRLKVKVSSDAKLYLER